MFKENKNIFYIAGSLILFIAIALIYTNPVFQRKENIQHDLVQYKGGAKELLDYRAKNGEETYWSDAMFGGMPTYQTGAQFRGDVIKYVDNALNFLPKPANYLFLLFAGFFLLGMTAVRNWKYALLGATFFGLSTYFYIIISAGHNGKVHTIAYFAPLLAGILLVYIRKKYLLGFAVTTLFMGFLKLGPEPLSDDLLSFHRNRIFIPFRIDKSFTQKERLEAFWDFFWDFGFGFSFGNRYELSKTLNK